MLKLNQTIIGLVCISITLLCWTLMQGIDRSENSDLARELPEISSANHDFHKFTRAKNREREGKEGSLSLEEKTQEYAKWLKEFLKKDEKGALELLSQIDPFDWEPSLIVPTLVEYFSGKENLFESIDALELLRGGKADFLFLVTVSELLGQHSSGEDPAKIIDFITEERNEDIGLRSRSEVGGQLVLSKENKSEIIDLIFDVEDEEMSESLATGALGRWAIEDIKELSAYLDGRPTHAKLDRGYEVLAHYNKREDPISSLEWALTIQSPERRYESASYSARELALKDPRTFNQWFATVDDPQLRSSIDEILNVKGYEVDVSVSREVHETDP